MCVIIYTIIMIGSHLDSPLMTFIIGQGGVFQKLENREK